MIMRGQLPKAYLRIDPNIDRAKADTRWDFIRLLCEANRQTRRGRFKSRALFDGLLGKAAAKRLLDAGDVRVASSGEIIVPGWEEWQEGDVTVAERQRRIRARRDESRDASVTQPLPDRIPPPAAPTPRLSTSRSGSKGEGEGSKARRENSTRGSVAPPARAKRPARAAARSSQSDPSDPRRPVEALLLKRYRYRRVTKAQWERLAELVDNEYPAGTARGADRTAGWQWLTELLEALPPDAGDPIEAAFAEVNRRIAARKAAAQATVAAHDQRTAGEPGPLASTAAAALAPKPNGSPGHSREELIERFRSYRGQVPDEALARQLQPHGLTLADLDDEPDFGTGPEASAP